MLFYCYGFIATVLYLRFYTYGFIPTVLEAVLKAERQKTNAVPYLNRSPLNIAYSFYFYDRFNAPSEKQEFLKSTFLRLSVIQTLVLYYPLKSLKK